MSEVETPDRATPCKAEQNCTPWGRAKTRARDASDLEHPTFVPAMLAPPSSKNIFHSPPWHASKIRNDLGRRSTLKIFPPSTSSEPF